MNKTIFSRQSECVQKWVVTARERAGLTQRQLADNLEREHSLVSRLELGERRLDVVEFFWLCKACGVDPSKEASRLMKEFGAI